MEHGDGRVACEVHEVYRLKGAARWPMSATEASADRWRGQGQSLRDANRPDSGRPLLPPRRTPMVGTSPRVSGGDVVNLLWAGLIVAGVTALAITAMLLVRRRAPAGSYFEDGDRAAGVFGVLATGFAVLLGFVVFLAFESYDTSRSGAETEAQIVTQQFETAQFFPVAARAPSRASSSATRGR